MVDYCVKLLSPTVYIRWAMVYFGRPILQVVAEPVNDRESTSPACMQGENRGPADAREYMYVNQLVL